MGINNYMIKIENLKMVMGLLKNKYKEFLDYLQKWKNICNGDKHGHKIIMI